MVNPMEFLAPLASGCCSLTCCVAFWGTIGFLVYKFVIAKPAEE